MDTMPWPPGRDDIHPGVVLASVGVGDDVLLKLRLVGGTQVCTLVDERDWRAGEPVHVHYATSLGGMRRIERVKRRAA